MNKKVVLTPHKVMVLKLIAGGLNNKQIAEELGVTKATVEGHVNGILNKLGASNRTHAVAIALRRGIIDQEDIKWPG